MTAAARGRPGARDRGDPGSLRAALRLAWYEVLGHESFADDSDFMIAGGSSLATVRVLARMNELSGDRITLVDLFDRRTFGEQLALLAARAAQSAESAGAAESAEDSSGAGHRLSDAQLRRLSAELTPAGRRPLAALVTVHVEAPVDLEAVRAAVRDLVKRHSALRGSLSWQDGRPRYAELPLDADWGIPVEDLRTFTPAEADRVLQTAQQRLVVTPIDLSRPPLLAGSLFRMPDDAAVVCLAVDDVASDRFSIGVLRRDLTELYRARRRGVPADLPSLGRTAAQLLTERVELADRTRDEALARWATLFDGYPLPPRFDLVTEPQRPFHAPARARRETLVAGPAAAGRFFGLAAAEGVGEQAAVLALAYATLHALTGETDICLVTAASLRPDGKAERVAGALADLVPVRCAPLPGGQPCHVPVRELLNHVQHCVWRTHDAYYPFERLIELYHGGAQAWERVPWVYVDYDPEPRIPSAAGWSVSYQPGPAFRFGRLADGGLETIIETAAGRYPAPLTERLSAIAARVLTADWDTTTSIGDLLRSLSGGCGCRSR